jgi:anti-sigma B factor antagonist
MNANIEKLGGFTVVMLAEESIDSSNVKDFKQVFQPVVDQGGKVIFDMSSIDFVDSSGLGSILSVMRQLTSKGGDLRICGMRKPVRALFELVRFHRILDVYNTREEAMNG